jgi:hypothetical protein
MVLRGHIKGDSPRGHLSLFPYTIEFSLKGCRTNLVLPKQANHHAQACIITG